MPQVAEHVLFPKVVQGREECWWHYKQQGGLRGLCNTTDNKHRPHTHGVPNRRSVVTGESRRQWYVTVESMHERDD